MVIPGNPIGHRLRAMREAMGLSQVEFARRAGMAQNLYGQWETGARTPRMDNAIALCEIYGYTLDWIFRGDASGLPWRLARLLPPEEADCAPEEK